MIVTTAAVQLLCVDCRTALGPYPAGAACNSCGRQYREIEGVWNWLPKKLDVAKINENAAQEALSEKFWRRFLNKRFRIESFEKNWLSKIVSAKTKSFLELGGGLCYVSALVKDAHPRITVIATDVSSTYLSRHSRRLGEVMEASADIYAAVDGENLPFADNQIDAISSQMVLYRVPDPARMLREIYRVLAPGGTYIGIERASPWLASWKENWMTDRAEKLGIAERPVTLRDWKSLLAKAGLGADCIRLLPGNRLKNSSLRYVVNALKPIHISIELTKPT